MLFRSRAICRQLTHRGLNRSSRVVLYITIDLAFNDLHMCVRIIWDIEKMLCILCLYPSTAYLLRLLIGGDTPLIGKNRST